MTDILAGLAYFLAALIALAIFQRRLHLEIQAIFLFLTRRADLTIALFSLVFLPGILVHETSHYLAARLMGVRTGRFSVLPRQLPNGRLQLGFVETSSTDFIRDAVIGSAPLITGLLVISLVTFIPLGMSDHWAEVSQGNLDASFSFLRGAYGQPDFWLWFYLIFVVSSTMYPSASDRRSWLPIFILISALISLALILGAGQWMLLNIGPYLRLLLLGLALALAISTLVHFLLFLPLWLIRRVLGQLLGMEVAQ